MVKVGTRIMPSFSRRRALLAGWHTLVIMKLPEPNRTNHREIGIDGHSRQQRARSARSFLQRQRRRSFSFWRVVRWRRFCFARRYSRRRCAQRACGAAALARLVVMARASARQVLFRVFMALSPLRRQKEPQYGCAALIIICQLSDRHRVFERAQRHAVFSFCLSYMPCLFFAIRDIEMKEPAYAIIYAVFCLPKIFLLVLLFTYHFSAGQIITDEKKAMLLLLLGMKEKNKNNTCQFSCELITLLHYAILSPIRIAFLNQNIDRTHVVCQLPSWFLALSFSFFLSGIFIQLSAHQQARHVFRFPQQCFSQKNPKGR